jgi:hypothetical protein
MGPITTQVNLASANVTGTLATTVIQYIPLFFGLGIMAMALGIAITSLQEVGILGEPTEEYREEYEEKKPQLPHKQTYEEYVRERLRVERMIHYGWLGKWW